jgi:hypothetical protein
MRRALLLSLVLGLLAPAAARATTADFEFHSDGSAVQPGAATGLGSPGSYQDIPFTIAPGDDDGAVSVGITWGNPADDFDLYVYFKPPGGGDLEQVASSAQGTTTEETAVIQAQQGPVEAGDYVIRVQNYLSSNPNFDGVVKFKAYTPPNKDPKAVLKAPKRVRAGKKVTLNASKSSDPDGSIASYAFDLDGDGTIETDNGSSPKLTTKFSPGFHHVTVRVVDDKGDRAYDTVTIAVLKKRKHHKG